MVVLTVKNLQHKSFKIEIDLSSTVQDLKEKIEKEIGSDYPASGQKLIYTDSYDIDESKFLVVLVTKPKPAQTSETTEEAAEESAEREDETSTTPTQTTGTTTTSTASSTNTSSTTQSTTTPNTGSAESLVVTGGEFDRMVENIMEMGYERPQVERALRASFNNPYTAVTYLVDGIPSNLDEAVVVEPVGDITARASDRPPAEGEESEPGDSDDPLAFLRVQPQFTQMRQMIRSNPQLLDAFIQQIGQTNPDLLGIIQQNQDAFVQMLNEETSSGGGGGTATTGGGEATGQGEGSSARGARQGEAGGRPGVSITVTVSDRNAIARLKALGNFPEDLVIEAYFACERNENLAAELLFSQTWD